MTYSEKGSSDHAYNETAGIVRRMARKLGFKGSLPVVPHPDQNCFVIALAYTKGTEDEHERRLDQLLQQIGLSGKATALEVKTKTNGKSKVNNVTTIKFREEAPLPAKVGFIEDPESSARAIWGMSPNPAASEALQRKFFPSGLQPNPPTHSFQSSVKAAADAIDRAYGQDQHVIQGPDFMFWLPGSSEENRISARDSNIQQIPLVHSELPIDFGSVEFQLLFPKGSEENPSEYAMRITHYEDAWKKRRQYLTINRAVDEDGMIESDEMYLRRQVIICSILEDLEQCRRRQDKKGQRDLRRRLRNLRFSVRDARPGSR